jgi:hypothetical protein
MPAAAGFLARLRRAVPVSAVIKVYYLVVANGAQRRRVDVDGDRPGVVIHP